MATLTYNNQQLTFSRASEFSMVPEYDPDGVDLLWHKVTFGATCVWNPATIGAANLQLGGTIKNIQFDLMQPRKPLTLAIGAWPVVVLPYEYIQNDPKQLLSAPDANFGPIPQQCVVQEIIGVKTAIVYYRIIFHLTTCKKVVLSNRWTVHAQINSDGFTTRTIRGRTIVRADVVADRTVTVNDFRAAVIVPPPDTFQRMSVDVTVSGNGTRLDWTVRDQETWLGVGRAGPAVRVQGNATAGISTNVKRLSDGISALAQLGGDLVSMLDWNPLKMAANAVAKSPALIGDLISCIPVVTAGGIMRVYGRADSQKANLANIAVNLIADRFLPLVLDGNLHVASIMLTQDAMTPFVEVRIDYYANMAIAPISGADSGPTAEAKTLANQLLDRLTNTAKALEAGAGQDAADAAVKALAAAVDVTTAVSNVILSLTRVNSSHLDKVMNMKSDMLTGYADGINQLFDTPQIINALTPNPKGDNAQIQRNLRIAAAFKLGLPKNFNEPADGAAPNNVNAISVRRDQNRPAPRVYINDGGGNSNQSFNETNGYWVGALLVQTLNDDCTVPKSPPDDSVAASVRPLS